MTNLSLGMSYVRKATDRLDVLDLLTAKGAHSDVVRETQEVVELAPKDMLRLVGVEPPKFHDVGGLLLEHRDRFPASIASELERAALISKKLRKEREFSFYGKIDFIPTGEYSAQDAEEARSGARVVAQLAQRLANSKEE